MTDEKRYISTYARFMATKLGRVVGSNADLLFIKSHNLLITWWHKVTWQIKNVLNSLSLDCRYKTWQKGGLWLGVTCPTTKPHIPLITWLREFAWQMNFVISLFPRGLLLLNLTRWWLIMRGHHSQSSVVLKSWMVRV